MAKSKTPKWDPSFTPSYTPKEMLEMGVFEGKYINNIKGLPKEWYKLPKVVGPKDDPDPELNYYGVKSRQPLSKWRENGWIRTDPNGHFEWYCKYFLGRRLGEEDEWQIKRWRSFVARHSAQVQAKCKKGVKSCHTKQRQGLLQWAWDSDTPMTEAQCKKNLERLTKMSNVSLESLNDLTTVNPQFIVDSREVDELYHLSFSGKKEGVWKPLTPAGTEEVDQDEVEFGEPLVPRISLSPTLEKCFRAIYPNIDFYFHHHKFPHLDIYAYRPKFKGHENVVKPETLTEQRWVWDAHVTEEHWVLEAVEMELVGRYRFYNTEKGSKDRGYKTKPFNDPHYKGVGYVGPTKVDFIPLKNAPALEHLPPSAKW